MFHGYLLEFFLLLVIEMANNIVNLNYKQVFNLLKEANKYDYVFLGEATHGTLEFYQIRLAITIILVTYFNFNTIFIEMEWSLGYQLNKYIHSKLNITSKTLLEKLFVKYPEWMSANSVIQDLLEFLKKLNENTTHHKVYIYGIDCQDIELAKQNVCSDSGLNCPLVKEIIKNYYKMTQSDANYWNIRDTFWFRIFETLKQYRTSRFILWAHNSHVGDSRANEREPGHINIGSILETQYDAYIIGFSTAIGTVMASKEWDQPGLVTRLNKPIKKSYEADFSKIATKYKSNSFMYICDRSKTHKRPFRYIGVVYNTFNELDAHYHKTNIDKEFDVVIFINKTQAVSVFLKSTFKITTIDQYKKYAKRLLNAYC